MKNRQQIARNGILVAFALLLSAQLMQGQGRGGDALLHEPVIRYQYIGGGLGYGYWKSEASFGVADNNLPCAFFSDGEGKGLMAEAKAILYPLQSTWFILSPRLRYESRSSSFITPLAGEPIKGENNERIILQQEAQVDGDFGTLALELMVGAEIAETGFYITAGGAGGLLVDGIYNYTERLLSPQGYVYAGTGTNEQQLVGGRSFDNFGTLVFDLRGSMGYMYRLSDQFALNIEGVYSYPLTSAFNSPDLLKQQGIFGTLGLLYNFGD